MSSAIPFVQGPAWHAGDLVGFDLETTGVDTSIDRVVTAAIVHMDRHGAVRRFRNWLVDSIVPIPAAATAVHGVGTQYARTHGRPWRAAIAEIIHELEAAWSSGLPVVIFNATYDLTLLDAEAARARLPRLGARPWWASAWVIDPLVIDRGLDPHRTGKRTLGATAEHYAVQARDPHSAVGDAVTACSVARALTAEHQLIATADAATMHSAQVGWHFDWAVHLQAYLRSRGDSSVEIDRAWPLRAPVVGRHRAPEANGPADVVSHRMPAVQPTGSSAFPSSNWRLASPAA